VGLFVFGKVAAAQDTTRAVLQLLYDNPQVRPTLVVVPVAGLDSVRAIVERDLDQSDRFELIVMPIVTQPVEPGALNLAPYRAMNAELALEMVPAGGALVTVRLYDVATGLIRNEGLMAVDYSGTGEGRMTVHRLSDEVVRWATGKPGIAATRVLYVLGNRVWRIDTDGYGSRPLTPAGVTAYSPAWSPDGRRFAYTELTDGQGYVVLQSLTSGNRVVLPGTERTMNITPSFSPDGNQIAFSRVVNGAYALHKADVTNLCCVERLTPGRFAENLSPTYSPDGRRIAFVSTRAGSAQIYVMSSDGTNQELLVPFDYGITGASFAPEWSPDGLRLIFHRSMGSGFQVLVFDITSDRVRQVTSEGRNEDASWAPDGRHIIFTSSRSGGRQLHILDLETSRVRSIPTPGTAQLATWSPRLSGAP
jgi:TolB protein